MDDREARAQNELFQSISAVSTAKASILKKNGINQSLNSNILKIEKSI